MNPAGPEPCAPRSRSPPGGPTPHNPDLGIIPSLRLSESEVERVAHHAFPGGRSVLIDSPLITALRGGWDLGKWLEDVLRRIPTATTANLHELLPGNGKPATE